jgi:UDP-N-acetylglucosamine--N-acetylmuramyl-(pentapeptide) pyrophosphoryl-undecaprenol N-acetylglucosamine transferase
VKGDFFFFALLLILSGLIFWGRWRWRRLAFRETRILLTGGGTGGHVNPAIAMAEDIKNREPESRFLYVGVRGKAEVVIVQKAGYPLRFISSEGYPGLRFSFRSLRFLCRLGLGLSQSIGILVGFAPRWVIATGGYVSAPIILATILLRFLRIAPTTIFLHEQNSVPGQLNALLGRWGDRVLLTFPQTLSFFPLNGVVVGYPIRHSIVPKPYEDALVNLPFEIPRERQVVFVFGGSQGARTINRAIVDALRFFLPYRDKLFIVHGVGFAKSTAYDAMADTEARLQNSLTPEERNWIKEFYYYQDYFHNIADIYSISDLIVCRSGAGSLNEISRVGKPALLIPKANLPGDHQIMNARAMKYVGAAEILFEDTVLENEQVLEKVEGEVLASKILRLLQNPDQLKEMAVKSRQFLRRHANERILSELYGDGSYNNGVSYQSIPFRPLLNNRQLLQDLRAAFNQAPQSYNPLAVVCDEDDLMYYRHRAAGLLSHEAWQDRNVGVKLIGLTHYYEKIPTLLHMMVDRTPAPKIQRLFGGDFEQVGFIRRNIVQALRVMNHWDCTVEKHLLVAIEDPYFEVRTQVCRLVAYFGPCAAGKEVWFQALLNRLNDKSFEVVVEAAKAMGEVGIDGRALETLLRLREHPCWQVRDAALKGIKRLLERHAICPSPEFLEQINHFILTATDFRPHFSIKETYQVIENYCRDKLTGKKAYEDSQVLYDAIEKRER